MSETLNTTLLSLLTALALLGSIISLPAILRRRSSSASSQETSRPPYYNTARLGWYILWLCTLSIAALFIYRWLFIVQHWSPLESHLDGLLLITTLLGLTILHVHWHWNLHAASPFGLPLVTILLAWAVCASRWTFHPFEISSLWNALHLTTIYLGSTSIVLAALAGILLLTVTHRLRQKSLPSQISPLGNLETLERLMIRASAVGFVLLSVGIISGLIILVSQNNHSQLWMTPKIILSLLLWLAYGAVINIHSYFAIRGKKAALLSIAGLVLLLATFALAIPRSSPDEPSTPSSPTSSSQSIIQPAAPATPSSSPSQEPH